MKKILLVIIILITLTGCYNYRELNDLAIVTAISVSKDNNEYKVVVQVVKPKKEQDTSNINQPNFVTFKSKGKSLQEAFRGFLKESPKKIYGTHMQILLLDENVAKSDLSDVLDFFAREPEVRNEFYVLVNKNSNLLEVLTPLDNISSQNIMESLEANNKYLGYANLITFNDLLSYYQNNKIEIALPTIFLEGNINNGDSDKNIDSSDVDTSIVLGPLAIFKNNKLVGYLSSEESLAYNIVMDNITNALITNKYSNDKYIVNELIRSKTSLKLDSKNNKINISIKGHSSIKEVNYNNINLKDENNVKKIEKDLNNQIEKLVKKSINNIIKKYNSDIFGFENLFYKEDYKYYEHIKNKWNKDIFHNLEIEVNSNFEIVEQGNILGGIKDEQ